MSWLLFAFLAYLFLAIASVFDRYLLIGPIANPRVYAIYHGLLWLGAGVVLLPFISFELPLKVILFGVGAGLARIFAIMFMAKGIASQEVSRVLPIIGALIPIFLFVFVLIFFPGSSNADLSYILAFALLIIGSVLISARRITSLLGSLKNALYPAIAAFLFAVGFLLTKTLFLESDFLSGLFIILLGGGLGAGILLLNPTAIKEIISNKRSVGKSMLFFVVGAGFGGLGVLSQFYAVFLAEPGQIPLINALEGIRDVFLLGLIYLVSLWNPQLLKEEMKGAVIGQKVFAILLIWFGLILLR